MPSITVAHGGRPLGRPDRRDCPVWCVDCWADMDPGTRFHHGRVRAVGGARVSVERFDDDAAAGEPCVGLTAWPDLALTPAQARQLAAALWAAAGEAQR